MGYLGKYIVGGIFFILSSISCYGQTSGFSLKKDSLIQKKKTALALSEVIVINMGVWSFDRYIAKSDFAYINWGTIKNNLATGFEWDSDQLGTNFVMHPYHGSLYFNAARSNGFDFFESIPFVVIGSLMWECFLENEPPSINDFLTTTGAGSMYGEITYRLSNSIINNSAVGANRVFREIAAGLLSPIHEINRLISGEAWKRDYNINGNRIPIKFNFSTGISWLQPQLGVGKKPFALLAAKLDYNPEMKEMELPYDWFSVDLRFNSGHRSFYLSKMDITAVLWNKRYSGKNGNEWGFGIYQHFDYWDASVRKYRKTPYRFAQVLAVGPGVYYKNKPKRNLSLIWKGYLTAIGLGGALSDYYWVDNRDYSFGSGGSVKTSLSVATLDNRIRLNVTAGNYTLFTWNGYLHRRKLYQEDIDMLNVQGDPGYTNFTSIEAEIGYWSKVGWNICFVPEWINRFTNYKYHPSRKFSSLSFCLKAGYTL